MGFVWDHRNHTYVEIDHNNQDMLEKLAHYMVEQYELPFIRRVITHRFFYSEEEEINNIMRYVIFFLNQGDLDEPHLKDCLPKERSVDIIVQRLRDYFTLHEIVDLEGFFTFRLRDYREGYLPIVERAIDEYILDKEYREYIRYLRDYVEQKPETIQLIHVYHLKDGKFLLFDQQGDPFSNEISTELLERVSGEGYDLNDSIVTTLVALAPGKIMLHTTEDFHPVLQTLRNVYGERIEICNGCTRCALWSNDLVQIDG